MLLNNLKEIRTKKSMSLRHFSGFLDIAESQYRRYEAEVLPSLQVALKISKKLGISVNEIWIDDPENSQMNGHK